MKLRYVTNKGCAIPLLRSKLAEQTLIGGGHQHLIPINMVRPNTPDHLKSKVTFCISNDECCILNDERCIKNDE